MDQLTSCPDPDVTANQRRLWKTDPRHGRLWDMVGPILITLVLLVALPLTFFLMGTVISVLLGHFLTKEGEASNEGSELIELNI